MASLAAGVYNRLYSDWLNACPFFAWCHPPPLNACTPLSVVYLVQTLSRMMTIQRTNQPSLIACHATAILVHARVTQFCLSKAYTVYNIYDQSRVHNYNMQVHLSLSLTMSGLCTCTLILVQIYVKFMHISCGFVHLHVLVLTKVYWEGGGSRFSDEIISHHVIIIQPGGQE